MSVKIEGVPDGYELVRIGAPKKGEFYIRPNGSVTDASFSFIEEIYPIVRKIEPKVRPMTRDEFLAAWKQRGFCPLVDTEQDIDTVAYVTVETEFDLDCVNMFNAGWCSMDELADYKFASDETYLTVEE